MGDDDIVNRLRLLSTGLTLLSESNVMRKAATEIERLRVIVHGWEHSARNAERDIKTLRAERDEARRMVCEKEETLGCDERGVPRNGSARDHAKQRGWDCFKENADV